MVAPVEEATPKAGLPLLSAIGPAGVFTLNTKHTRPLSVVV
jgi:hypothetical protein